MGTNIKICLERIKQLLCLEAAIDYGSISRAAEANGIKQPNLSAQIKALEKDINQKVIFRHSKGIGLTENGYTYYAAARDIKNILSNTENFSTAGNEIHGNIRLWISDGLASIYLAKCFNDFCLKYPKINLDINCSLEMPKLYEFDLSVVFEKPSLKSLIIVNERDLEFSLYCSKEYIARNGQPQSLSDLCKNHKICNNATYTNGWPKWNKISAKAQHVTTITNSSNMLFNLIQNGIGVGLLPKAACHKQKNLVEIPNVAPKLSKRFYLISKQESAQNKKIKAFIDIIDDVVLK